MKKGSYVHLNRPTRLKTRPPGGLPAETNMPYFPIPDQLVWTSNPESGLSLYMRKNVLAFTTHLALLPASLLSFIDTRLEGLTEFLFHNWSFTTTLVSISAGLILFRNSFFHQQTNIVKSSTLEERNGLSIQNVI